MDSIVRIQSTAPIFVPAPDMDDELEKSSEKVIEGKPECCESDEKLIKNFLDPSIFSELNGVTRDLALTQTSCARSVIYFPSVLLQEELARAASNLHKIFLKLTGDQVSAIGARLLGPEGLISGREPSEIIGTISRVMSADSQPGASGGSDRMIFLALLGDIGALFATSHMTKGAESRSECQANDARNRLNHLFQEHGLSALSSATVERVRQTGGAKTVGPQKEIEKFSDPGVKLLRGGIHNYADIVDCALGVARHDRLPKARWDLALLAEDRMVHSIEPMVGHMSGSPSELLQIWDLLCGIGADDLYTGFPQVREISRRAESSEKIPLTRLAENEMLERYARAAATCAFYIAGGFHSAVEISEGILAYDGQNVRDVVDKDLDAAYLFDVGAATGLICELLKDHTTKNDSSYSYALHGSLA